MINDISAIMNSVWENSLGNKLRKLKPEILASLHETGEYKFKEGNQEYTIKIKYKTIEKPELVEQGKNLSKIFGVQYLNLCWKDDFEVPENHRPISIKELNQIAEIMNCKVDQLYFHAYYSSLDGDTEAGLHFRVER